MPGSSTILDWALVRDLQEIQPKTAYEFGVGRGRIGGLVKKITPTLKLTGFEINKQYVIDHKKTLTCYNNIIVTDVYDWLQNNVDWWVDVVLIPDMIEHLPLSMALDVLDHVQQRCRWILIKTPLSYRQNTHFNNIKEAHISELTLQKLVNYNIYSYIREDADGWSMAYYRIKGWI